MVYGDLQFIDLIIFGGVAIFLIYRLRGVLGKRTGIQKKDLGKNSDLAQDNQINKKTNHPLLKESELTELIKTTTTNIIREQEDDMYYPDPNQPIITDRSPP